MKTTLTLPELYRPVEDALDLVRAQMMQIWQDAIALVRVPTGVAPRMGGKMLRPALCLLSAGAIGARDVNRFASLAAAFEALHIASLAHDDVIDRALLRRGDRSLNGLWDNHAAVLGGDYLVARSVEIMATYDSCPVIANAIQSVRRMAEGELYFFGKLDSFTKEDCIHLAEQKTASLFAEACSAATYIVDGTHRQVLHRFGTALGIAFQIVDDLLDVTQPADQLGKPSCGDLVEGKRTIPILYMREALDAEGLRRLDAMRDADITDADRDWAIAMAEETGARERTEAEARAFADAALHELSQLPASPYRDSMEGIVEFVLVRGS